MIIKSHDVTLYGGNDIDIILRPLCDDHLPLLYKWCADPDVVYWTDGENIPYSVDTVHDIYGRSSQSAFCFVIEVNGVLIGECWLSKIYPKNIADMYPESMDIRRIDMMIGEKEYWNKGIGTELVGMLVDFAFNGENTDVLHGVVFDFNMRSRRVFEKNGFQTFLKDSEEIYYRLMRQEFVGRRRNRVPAEKRFMFPIADLQPSQLYISEGKLRLVKEWFDPDDMENFDPIPIKPFDGKILMTDGHTRAVAAHLAGWDSVPVYWDEDELDMHAYATDVKWCDEENIHSPVDLSGRIVPHKDYERLWRKRCMEMIL